MRIHIVRPKETFVTIASKYQVTLDDLRQFNPDFIQPNCLVAGMKVYIPNFKHVSNIFDECNQSNVTVFEANVSKDKKETAQSEKTGMLLTNEKAEKENSAFIQKQDKPNVSHVQAPAGFDKKETDLVMKNTVNNHNASDLQKPSAKEQKTWQLKGTDIMNETTNTNINSKKKMTSYPPMPLIRRVNHQCVIIPINDDQKSF